MTPDLARIAQAIGECRDKLSVSYSGDGPDGYIVILQGQGRVFTGTPEACSAYIDVRCSEAAVRAMLPVELLELNARAVPGWRYAEDHRQIGFILAPSTNDAIGGDDVVLSSAYSDRSPDDDRSNVKLAFAAVGLVRSLSAILEEPQP